MKAGTASLVAGLVAAATLVVGAGTAAAAGSTAAHSASAQCGQGRISVNATMQTVQSVMGRPPTAAGQHVAYQAILYRWNGSAWDKIATGPWLWSYAASGQSTSTFRTFDTRETATTEFTVASGHYYGVVVDFYWYANSDVGYGRTGALAQHLDMGGPSNGYCRA